MRESALLPTYFFCFFFFFFIRHLDHPIHLERNVIRARGLEGGAYITGFEQPLEPKEGKKEKKTI